MGAKDSVETLFDKPKPKVVGDYLAHEVDVRREERPVIYSPTAHGAVRLGRFTIEAGFRKLGIPYIIQPFLVEKSRGGNVGYARVVIPTLGQIRNILESIDYPCKHLIFDDTTSEAITVMTIYDCLTYLGVKDDDIILGGLADASNILDFSWCNFNPEPVKKKYLRRRNYLKTLVNDGKILPASRYLPEREQDDSEVDFRNFYEMLHGDQDE